jgi:branched-chain amino acid transport system permease protein
MSGELFSQTLLAGVNLGAFYALIALGFTLMYGIMGVLNMAHGTIYMVGAMIAFYIYGQAGLSFFIALPLAVVITGLFGVLVERVLIRPSGGELLQVWLITVALWLGLQGVAYLVFGFIARGVPPPVTGTTTILGLGISNYRLLVIGVAAVLIGGVYYLIHRTKIGLAMRAVEEDKVAATIQGVNLNMLNGFVFLVGFALAGAAGVLMAPAYSISPTIGLTPLLKAFMIVALGGMGSVPGAIAGGLLLGLADSFMGVLFGISTAYILTWVMIIIILIFRPKGLMGAY